MTDPANSLSTIAAWPEVAAALAEAREACTQLRWHQALRRRIPQAAAESRVRGAHASAEADGARSDLRTVRDHMRGALPWSDRPDPTQLILRGAVQATSETEHVAALFARAPRQALARLHVAAAEPLLPAEQVGRPRRPDEDCGEFTDLGEPPRDVEPRIEGLVALLSVPDAPALLVAALLHAEIATVRPFARGNGLVARAAERALVQARGLDPTGVAVPEFGHAKRAGAAYIGALTAYGTGSRQGLVVWIRHCAAAIVDAAGEGRRIADAVLVGRLD